MIRQRAKELDERRERLRLDTQALQKECPHETSVYSAHGSTGNCDRDDSYWFCFYCYDCQKRWTTDQSVRPVGPLKVKEIDYAAKPEIIELQMKIERLK